MKKTIATLIGNFARAAVAAAIAAAVPAASYADGAIRSIYAVPTDQHTFPNPDDPVRLGEEINFDILLLNKPAADSHGRLDEAWTNSWTIQYIGSGDKEYDAANSPLKLGIIVNGRLREATFTLEPDPGSAWEYTVMHVTYKTRAGDLAMPLKLAAADGTEAPAEGNPTYKLYNDNLWQIVDAESKTPVDFCFGPESISNPPSRYRDEIRDINLEKAGIYLNTVDFDSYYDNDAGETPIWREIYSGMTETTGTHLPSIYIPGGNSSANDGFTVYLRVADTNCATLSLKGQAVQTYGSGENAVQVYPVTIPAGATNVWFRLKGVTPDTETEIYMGTSPTNIYDSTGHLINNFVTRRIACVKSPDPFVRFTLNDGEASATIAADNAYNIPKARLTVELSEAYTDAVTVNLNPVVNDSTDDVFADGILGISAGSQAANFKDRISSVTIPAGETEKTVYIYALGSTIDAEANGITFTPSVDGAAAAFYTGSNRECTLYVDDIIPAISSPETGSTLSQKFTVGVEGKISLTVSDSYTDLHTNGWTVVYWDMDRDEEPVLVEDVSPKYNSTTGTAGLEVPLELYTLPVTHVGLYVVDPNGNESDEIDFYVNVDARKTLAISIDGREVEGSFPENSAATLPVSVTLSQTYKADMLVWLVPANDETRKAVDDGLVSSEVFSSRPLKVPANKPQSVAGAGIVFHDGLAPDALELEFTAVVSNGVQTAAIDEYLVETYYVHVYNIQPAVSAASMSGSTMTLNGGTFDVAAAKGVPATFSIPSDGLYEPSNVDRTNIVARWTVRDGVPGQYYNQTYYVTGGVSQLSIEHAFNTGDVTQRVAVVVRDKDMDNPATGEAWSQPFEFWVSVSSAPTVKLTPWRKGTLGAVEQVADGIYKETEYGNGAWIEVQLTAVAQDPLNVLLTVENLNAEGFLKLSNYDIRFPSGTISQRVYLSELDGVNPAGNRGFSITAAVTNTTMNAAYGKPWNEFFMESEQLVIAIDNEPPEIRKPTESQAATTNTSMTAGVPFTIPWEIWDVDADLYATNTVTWTVGSHSETFTGKDMKTGEFTYTFDPADSGYKEIVMRVEDKDGGVSERHLWYYIAPTKRVFIYPYGPYASSNSRYANARGLGRGRVYAEGNSPIVNSFRQRWSFPVGASVAPVHAYGYTVGESDDGKLSGFDLAITDKGGKADTNKESTVYYKYSGKFADNNTYDSYFYVWIDWSKTACLDTESNAVNGKPKPAKSGTVSVQLPDYQEGAIAYEDRVIEAVFSREWRPADNCGDINQDGIPDVYVFTRDYENMANWYNPDGEDGTRTDLTSLANLNLDGDYFPSGAPSGTDPIVPGLTNTWAAAERAFTARLEIRGMHNGLNLAGEGKGGTNDWVRPGGIQPTYGDFSDAERFAYNLAVAQNSGNRNTWSPERPTDPTTADTDGDGYPDGYEYWFWYYAKVGWFENGRHRFLTGERYVPTRPDKGALITSAEICRAFDPVVYNDKVASRDTDNDGIPDVLEFELGTNPIHWDTDQDGLPDGWELANGLNPTDPDDSGYNQDGDVMASSMLYMRVLPTVAGGVLRVVGLPVENVIMSDMYYNTETREYELMPSSSNSLSVGRGPYAPPDGRLVFSNTVERGWLFTVNATRYISTVSPSIYGAEYTVTTNFVNLTDEAGEITNVLTNVVETVKSGTATLKNDCPEATTFIAANGIAGYVRGMPVRVLAGTQIETGPIEIEWTRRMVAGAVPVLGEDGDATNRAFNLWQYGKNPWFATGAETGFQSITVATNELGDVYDDYEDIPVSVVVSTNWLELVTHDLVHPAQGDYRSGIGNVLEVEIMHWQVYQHFGFNPLTGWGWNYADGIPSVNPRWEPSAMISTLKKPQRDLLDKFSGYRVGGRIGFGAPVNTRPYTTYDEFLVQHFLYNAGSIGAPGQNGGDTTYTTTPLGTSTSAATEEGSESGDGTTYSGVDSDGDGVPDGWELYIMAGPNSSTNTVPGVVFTEFDPTDPRCAPRELLEPTNTWFSGVLENGAAVQEGEGESIGRTHIVYEYSSSIPFNSTGKMYFKPPRVANPKIAANRTPYMSPWSPNSSSALKTDYNPMFGDSDGLTEAGEFAGTDVAVLYKRIAKGIAEPDSSWLNKFWPTDPWNADTDGDGVSDYEERNGLERGSNIYGTPSDDGSVCIAGAGLNPNSVDTDIDGLPDRWELQYLGSVQTSGEGEARIAGGMDGTIPDAYTWSRDRDCDYDHDGLQNWQEYMTCALRCFRYDDIGSPWTVPVITDYRDPVVDDYLGTGIPGGGNVSTQLWYGAAVVDGVSPNVLNDQFDWGLAYFKQNGKAWDMAVNLSYMYHDGPDHTGFGRPLPDALRLQQGMMSQFVSSYVGCSPLERDTDGDSLDDYWELFHGLNPMLGEAGATTASEGGGKDIVAMAYSGAFDALSNPWTSDGWRYWEIVGGMWHSAPANLRTRNIAAPRGPNPSWDFTTYLWMNGDVNADPDGDDIRNQLEGIIPNLQARSTWLHTDPSPLWMTDSSYTNALTYRYYKTIDRPAFTIYSASNEVVDVETFWKETNIVETAYGAITNIEEKSGWVTVTNKIALPIQVERTRTIETVVTNWNIVSIPVYYQDMYVTTVTYTNGYTTMTTNIDDKIVVELDPNIPAYTLNYWGAAGGYLFAFEENEGFDTDNDGTGDKMEISAGALSSTDPIHSGDPLRRQAMYFPGLDSAVESRTNPRHGLDDEMMFLTFTVELWAKPEDAARDQVLIERSTVYPDAHTQDRDYIRRNFEIGISGGLWYAGYDSKGTGAIDGNDVRVTGIPVQTGEWTHLAAVYDGERLTLYVNGRAVNNRVSRTQPANGVEYVKLSTTTGVEGYDYVGEHALLIGATAVSNAALSIETARPDWNCYGEFYKGYIDEVRIWDGARTDTQIRETMDKRCDFAFAATNRLQVYNAKFAGATRNATVMGAEAVELPPELVYHYGFDDVFGAIAPEYIATSPFGFAGREGLGENRALYSRPEGWVSPWWAELPVRSTVYDNYAYLPWTGNTMTHLPLFDGSVRDSMFWTQHFAGSQSAESLRLDDFLFPRTADPYGWYHPMLYTGDVRVYTTREFNETARVEYKSIGEFTRRSEFTGGTDLLPLGGAYARTSSDMWDGNGPSTVWNITGVDDNENWLPDWWEDFVMSVPDVYTDLPEKFLSTALVTRYGQRMTLGEAYMRDLARGASEESPEGDPDFAAQADADRDGLPDWWELVYGLAGETALDDHDNDQLSNFSEYLIAEAFSKYGFPLVRPDAISTFGFHAPDYFLKVGKLYIGEMFSDHDYIEDWWEDGMPVYWTSRFHSNAYDDEDGDGWGNMAEARYSLQVTPISASLRGHYTSSGTYVRDFPQPTINVTVYYNGRKGGMETAKLVVQSSRDPLFESGVDATFVSTDSATASSGNQYVELGRWRDRRAVGTLQPGNVDASALALEHSTVSTDASCEWTYSDCGEHEHEYEKGAGTYEEYLQAKLLCRHIKIVSNAQEWKSFGEVAVVTDEQGVFATLSAGEKGVVGTVNLLTGSYDIDLGALSTTNGTKFTSADVFRLAYAVRDSVGSPRELHFSRASSGWLREGVNYFRVFADLDDSGTWTPGEPIGYPDPYGVRISWRETSFDVNLTDTSASMPRIDVSAAVSANTPEGVAAANDRDMNGYRVNPNYDVSFAGTNMPGASAVTRIRIARTMINGWLACYTNNANVIQGTVSETVFDRTLDLGSRASLTEADLIVDGVYDLDWGGILGNWTNRVTGLRQTVADFASVTNVAYRIIVGYGEDNAFVTNNLLARGFVNGFEYGAVGYQTPCVPVSPAGILTSGRVTFKWSHTNSIHKAYPAFRLRVWDSPSGGSLVFDSGVRRAPRRDDRGDYVWTAPLYTMSPTLLGKMFNTTNNYSWAVSMLDAKFTEPNANEERMVFRVNTSGNMAGQTDHGSVHCRVKYFGPSAYAAKITVPAGLIRVQAFQTPDFTGLPACETIVTNTADVANPTNASVNASLVGLEPGTYYVRAFIDTDGDLDCSPWESWGYANHVGTTRKQVYDAKPLIVRYGVNEKPVADIFIEDMDTDNDGFPDAWEYSNAPASARADGTFLRSRGPASGPTFYTRVNKDLAATLKAFDLSAYTSFLTYSLMSAGALDTDGDGLNDYAELLLGTNPNRSYGASAEGLSAQMSGISATRSVSFKISAESVSPSGGETVADPLLYDQSAIDEAAASPAAVRWVLEYTPVLGGEWEQVGEGTALLEEGKTEEEIAREAREASSYDPEKGYYRVRILND